MRGKTPHDGSRKRWPSRPRVAAGIAATLLFSAAPLRAEEVSGKEGIPPGMTRAEVAFEETATRPRAVLVLCPGANGDGAEMARGRAWRTYASGENLGLAGIQFQSPPDLLRRCGGYYRAGEGSGRVLLEAVDARYGQGMPLVLFGFSGGAHFVTRFVAWCPGRVLAWSAMGAGALDDPARGGVTRGLVACGGEDPRLGGALMFFKRGRAAGQPWLWMCLPGVGHECPEGYQEFSRRYFSAVLHPDGSRGMWVDIDSGGSVGAAEAGRWPSLSGWLPDRALHGEWRAEHETWGARRETEYQGVTR